MTAPTVDKQFAYVDAVLEQACVQVQLTQPQYDDATQKYGTIGKWLADPNSALYRYAPDIYPQGSMSIGTTIRPWRGEEFDLDAVCQLHYCGGQPATAIYDLVATRLRDHGTYRNILELKNRCLRINYAGNFHLDIIPACPNGDTGIKVPDRNRAAWVFSNPLGYAKWFFTRCEERRLLLKAEARVRPVPSNVPSEEKFPLQRAVQLLKRHRDSFFKGNPDAARSILLTTLAAREYQGHESLTLALDSIVDGIRDFLRRSPGIPVVPNPTNPQENFAAGWNTQTYPQFVEYLDSVRQHLDRLMLAKGIDEVRKVLGGFVGDSLSDRAILTEARNTQQSRSQQALRVVSRTGQLSSTAGIIVPRNNFYGE
jgi:hypothetical protein